MSPSPDPEAWLTLALTPGIGPTRFQELLRAFGSPDGALAAPFAFLCTVPGISRACATAIKEAAQRRWGAVALEAVEKLGAETILFSDPHYPAMLREISDPPMVLFAWGALSRQPTADSQQLQEASTTPAVGCGLSAVGLSAAIVGTRHPTQYGIDVTHAAATACGEAGITVVSGMARGCDAIAHQGVLDAGGTTIGVLGNGFGVIYPAANRALYERVRAEGVLLSEFAPGERPHTGSFPRRNRIISGLARATLVVEAGGTSGALITAGFALDQGREVLAVPGPITSNNSVGTNRLLRDGATPYLGCGDLLGLYPEVEGGGSRVLSEEDPCRTNPPLSTLDPLLRHVPPDGALLDTIVDASGWPVAQVLDRLLEFELEGRVEQRPGRVFRRVS
jgi:DNA processing protein